MLQFVLCYTCLIWDSNSDMIVDCVGNGKEDRVHIVGHCPVLASKRNRILGRIFWRPKDLQSVRVNSLLTNTRPGIVL